MVLIGQLRPPITRKIRYDPINSFGAIFESHLRASCRRRPGISCGRSPEIQRRIPPLNRFAQSRF